MREGTATEPPRYFVGLASMLMIVPESPWLARNSHKTDVSLGKASVMLQVMVMFCRFCTDRDVSGIVTLGITTKGFR